MTSKSNQAENFLDSDVVRDDFFISIVENKLKINRDQFKLKLVLLFEPSGRNENYTSVLYRAKIKIEHNDGRKESVHAIIKALLELMPEFNELGVFAREIKMYEDMIKSFHEIWERTGEAVNFAPKCIKFETDPYEILVLDDLSKHGYVMADRKGGVDLALARMSLNKLAKFHTASAVRFEKEGVIAKQFDRNSLKIPEPLPGAPNPIKQAMTNMLKAFNEAVDSWGPEYKIYADKLKKWTAPNLSSGYMIIAEPMRCGFKVLNHGDFWINNCMIKYNEENIPIDVLMIDFQMNFWGSPTCDLFHFFITSLQDDIKVVHFNDLIEHYHSELVSGLKKLQYKKHIPTLEELQADLFDKGSFAVSALIIFLFPTKINTEMEINLDQVFLGGEQAEEILKIIFTNELYAKACQKWLPFFNERGFLDSLI